MKRSWLSPLEILLSSAIESRSAVYGSGIPETLMPEPAQAGNPLDLAILAPTITECADPAWLNAVIQSICRDTHDGTVVYVLVPPFHRLRIATALRRRGFQFRRAVLHLPSFVNSRYLVPLSPASLTYMLEEKIAQGRVMLLLKTVGYPLLASLMRPAVALPSVGLVFGLSADRTSPAIAMFTKEAERGGVVASVHTSWRKKEGPVTLRLFKSSRIPLGVGKMRLHSSEASRTIHEAECLRRAARNAQSPKIAIPRPISVGGTERFPVLYESHLPGHSAARVLRSSPGKLPAIVQGLSNWLCEWNQRTSVQSTVTVERFRRDLMTRAEFLSKQVSDSGYIQWLTTAFSAVIHSRMTFTDAHNDLTMRNVLIADNSSLGIVDWEESSEQAWPLADLFYAVADAIAATNGYHDRVTAMQEAFTSHGRYAAFARSLIMSTVNALTLPPLTAALAFHACWLQHACNEHRRGTSDRPFLRILKWVIATRDETFDYLGVC